uniref:Uncharacterized protein n=1 Tax=Chromera velia CCMP2878 TaxID=1169474 RepID=A0A0G4G542_9ALVE|eukprot:Cvel_20220.t1-p1 / transcript=Cvel_20220.t1 / gene=Cvel_20220 / organism=Chromera_velia_CCMP2878 / gene_product=Ras guanine nucleotide exchange factor F, putative / transcript_product=Ras guanine nucleotide exchange factor F, putative / location=Cvel_scaffold1800:11638-16631(-) / protein_length=604 / sequence_SO=supercontig / SO=protein_coding / is_pseudo=false
MLVDKEAPSPTADGATGFCGEVAGPSSSVASPNVSGIATAGEGAEQGAHGDVTTARGANVFTPSGVDAHPPPSSNFTAPSRPSIYVADSKDPSGERLAGSGLGVPPMPRPSPGGAVPGLSADLTASLFAASPPSFGEKALPGAQGLVVLPVGFSAAIDSTQGDGERKKKGEESTNSPVASSSAVDGGGSMAPVGAVSDGGRQGVGGEVASAGGADLFSSIAMNAPLPSPGAAAASPFGQSALCPKGPSAQGGDIDSSCAADSKDLSWRLQQQQQQEEDEMHYIPLHQAHLTQKVPAPRASSVWSPCLPPSNYVGGLSREASPHLLRKWKTLEVEGRRPTERFGALSLVHKDAIYIFGGDGKGGCLENIWKYEIGTKLLASKAWEEIVAKHPPAVRSHAVGDVYEDKFHIFRGCSGITCLNDLSSFNFESYEWQNVDSLGDPPSRRCGSTAGYNEGRWGIFCLGGEETARLSSLTWQNSTQIRRSGQRRRKREKCLPPERRARAANTRAVCMCSEDTTGSRACRTFVRFYWFDLQHADAPLPPPHEFMEKAEVGRRCVAVVPSPPSVTCTRLWCIPTPISSSAVSLEAISMSSHSTRARGLHSEV